MMLHDSIDLVINDSNREMITPTRMAIKNCVLTEAIVNNYLGKEIKGYAQAGLKPDEIYGVYRPLEELEKALPQYNGLDAVDEHHSIAGEKTNRHLTIGATGESATIKDFKVLNTVFVTDKDAIRDIELATKSRDQIGKRKLSCSYDYTPVFEKGVFRGKRYDVKIIDLKLDHVALVKEGRVETAGISDSIENLKGINFMNKLLKNALKGIFGLETIDDSQVEQVLFLADKAKDEEECKAKDNETEEKKEKVEDNEEENKKELERLKKGVEHEKAELKAKDNEEEKEKEKAEMKDAINAEVKRQIKERTDIQLSCSKIIGRLSDSALSDDVEKLLNDTLVKCGLNIDNKSFEVKKIMLDTLVNSNVPNQKVNHNIKFNDTKSFKYNNSKYSADELNKIIGVK